jgi:hypothetical protein
VRGCQADAVHANRLLDVFQLRRADILNSQRDLAGGILANPPGDADTTRLSEPLQARRDVHPVAQEIAVRLHRHVGRMKANTKLDALLHAHRLLDGYRALHRLHPTRKLGQQTVASCFEHASTMSGHLRIDHAGRQRSQLRQRARFVGPDEARISHDISR